MPEHLKPEPVNAPAVTKPSAVDGSLLAIVTHWRIVIAELITEHGIDLYDPAVLARPWPGIRTLIFTLIDMPDSRLRAALTRR